MSLKSDILSTGIDKLISDFLAEHGDTKDNLEEVLNIIDEIAGDIEDRLLGFPDTEGAE
jgi:hypothetical protein